MVLGELSSWVTVALPQQGRTNGEIRPPKGQRARVVGFGAKEWEHLD